MIDTQRRSFFSSRQCDVAALFLLRKSAKAIGGELTVSPRTAEYHITQLKNKLGCRKKFDLLFLLIERINFNLEIQ